MVSFFFQAEDGIRDYKVTGVQTCALPIWSVPSSRVTNSRVSVGAGRPITSGLSAGVRSTRVVTWVIFMAASLRAQGSRGGILPRRAARGGGRAPPPSGVEGPASLRGRRGAGQSWISGGGGGRAPPRAPAWGVPAGPRT